mgnify:CR=1 FL=1
MNLNRRVPNGLPGGVRGRKFYYFLLLDYIKILVSEQGNAACEKLSNCHNLLIMRNDKKDYRNSQHFAFAF